MSILTCYSFAIKYKYYDDMYNALPLNIRPPVNIVIDITFPFVKGGGKSLVTCILDWPVTQ